MRAAHFHGVVQLALGVDRFRGALELPKTWEIVGPTRPRAHLSQSAPADRLKRPRHPFGPVVAIRSGHCVPLSTATTDVFLISHIYPIYRHTPCASDPNSQRQCKYEECSVVGGSRDPMMLTSERRRIEDLIATISYADSRCRLGPECQH